MLKECITGEKMAFDPEADAARGVTRRVENFHGKAGEHHAIPFVKKTGCVRRSDGLPEQQV